MKQFLCILLIISLSIFTCLPNQAIAQGVLDLPEPGTMVGTTSSYNPALIKGIIIDPNNPLKLDFIVHPGDDQLKGEALKDEANKLIKYFMTALTIPENDMWVNLSPYESNRIVPDNFGQTEMGRDLLAQDYILKQLTATLMYPDGELGSSFWKKVYVKAAEKYGTIDIPVNTFNKVWILPDKALVYVNGASAFVVESHLKVMLEQDYFAFNETKKENKNAVMADNSSKNEKDKIATEIVREIIIPEIEKEVNSGKNFSNLRQVYNSMILATWYKVNLKESLLSYIYVDKSKVGGIEQKDPAVNHKIYDQYVAAFQKGVYDYIKEEYDPLTQETIPKKYFSGGIVGKVTVQDASRTTLVRSRLAKNLQRTFMISILLTALNRPARAQENPSSGNKNELVQQLLKNTVKAVQNRNDLISQGYDSPFDSTFYRIVGNLPEGVQSLLFKGKLPAGRTNIVPYTDLESPKQLKNSGPRENNNGFGVMLEFPFDRSGLVKNNTVTKEDPLGGIDLNPDNLMIQVENQKEAIEFNFDPEKIKNISISGFMPVITNVVPILNVDPLLGESSPDANLPSASNQNT